MTRPRASRGAFTLIELLVVLGIIGVLAGLILPAVQGAREAARRASCAGNLRQVGIALTAYADAHGAYPPGRVAIYDPRHAGPDPPCTAWRVDKGPLVAILPFLEQGPLYDAINQDVSIFALENTTIHTARVGSYACPSDPAGGALRRLPPGKLAPMAPDGPEGPRLMAAASYAASFGSFDVVAMPGVFPDCRVPSAVRHQCNGTFSDVHPIRPADIADGLGQTLFAAEKAVTTFDGMAVVGEGQPDRYGWWVSGNLSDTLFTAFYRPNAFRRLSVYGFAARVRSASSLHPGGLHALMGDGSVRFVAETIASWPADPITGAPSGAVRDPAGWWEGLPRPGVWQALATRGGGELIDGGSD